MKERIPTKGEEDDAFEYRRHLCLGRIKSFKQGYNRRLRRTRKRDTRMELNGIALVR